MSTRGFTLIEMLIGLVVMGILVSVAYSSYAEYMITGRRSDGKIALMELAGKMERYYGSHASYAGATLNSVGMRDVSSAGYYTLSISSATDMGYRILATPIGAQEHDAACGALWMDQLGNKRQMGNADAGVCW